MSLCIHCRQVSMEARRCWNPELEFKAVVSHRVQEQSVCLPTETCSNPVVIHYCPGAPFGYSTDVHKKYKVISFSSCFSLLSVFLFSFTVTFVFPKPKVPTLWHRGHPSSRGFFPTVVQICFSVLVATTPIQIIALSEHAGSSSVHPHCYLYFTE